MTNQEAQTTLKVLEQIQANAPSEYLRGQIAMLKQCHPVYTGCWTGFLNHPSHPCTPAHVGCTVYLRDNETVQSVADGDAIRAALLCIEADGKLRLQF